MSVTLFLALAAFSVATFLFIRVGRVTVERRIPILVNYLIEPALILSLALIVVDSTLQIPLLALLTSLKRLLWKSTQKLTIQSARQRARALHYRDGFSYADILNCGTGPSRRSHRVRSSSSLSSTAPSSSVAEFIYPKRTSVYSPSSIRTLTTSNRFTPIGFTVPLMEGSILDDLSPLCSSPGESTPSLHTSL